MSARVPIAAARLPSLRDRRARDGVFFAIYLYQGFVAGFSLTALANHVAGLGLPAGEVGLHFALIGLPWTLQPLLWGPLVDRSSGGPTGRRRGLALRAALGAQACLGLLMLVPGPEALGRIGLVLMLHSLFASLLDTACDRLIMDHVPDAELGRVSGVTRGGFVVGTSLGAALFAQMLPAAQLSANVALLLALSSLALLPLLLVRERPGDALLARRGGGTDRPARERLTPRRFLARLVAGLRGPRMARLLALCFAVDLAQGLFELRFSVEMIQGLGWDAKALSAVQAGLALASGTLGALLVGFRSDRAGAVPTLTGLFAAGAAAFGLAAGLTGLGLAGSAALLVLALTGLLPTLLVVALVPALMRASRDGPDAATHAATRFELLMAAMNLGSVAGSGLSGASVGLLPTWAAALFAGTVLLAATLACRRPGLLFPREAEGVENGG